MRKGVLLPGVVPHFLPKFTLRPRPSGAMVPAEMGLRGGPGRGGMGSSGGTGRGMKPIVAARPRDEVWARGDGIGVSMRPLVRPAPRSAMFFPLVVLVAVLPGLYALNSWDLNPPSPWWGLRGLAVLDGLVLDQVPAASQIKPALEAWTFRTVAFQPP